MDLGSAWPTTDRSNVRAIVPKTLVAPDTVASTSRDSAETAASRAASSNRAMASVAALRFSSRSASRISTGTALTVSIGGSTGA